MSISLLVSARSLLSMRTASLATVNSPPSIHHRRFTTVDSPPSIRQRLFACRQFTNTAASCEKGSGQGNKRWGRRDCKGRKWERKSARGEVTREGEEGWWGWDERGGGKALSWGKRQGGKGRGRVPPSGRSVSSAAAPR